METNPMRPKRGDALVLVDLQRDFLPGGSLAVPCGDEVIPPLSRAVKVFEGEGLPIYATRDWHPSNHCSFKAQGGPWPPHCVKGTQGAELSAELKLPSTAKLISKAQASGKDAYSGFDGTALHDELQAEGVTRLFVGGLATEYCVSNTVKDALKLGYQVFLLEDATRAVNVRPDDEQKARVEMQELGAVPVTTSELMPSPSRLNEAKPDAA